MLKVNKEKVKKFLKEAGTCLQNSVGCGASKIPL